MNENHDARLFLNRYEILAQTDPKMAALLRIERRIANEVCSLRRSLARPDLRKEDRAGLDRYWDEIYHQLKEAHANVHEHWEIATKFWG